MDSLIRCLHKVTIQGNLLCYNILKSNGILIMESHIVYIIRLVESDNIYATYYVTGISIDPKLRHVPVSYNTIKIAGALSEAKHFKDLYSARKVIERLRDTKVILQYNTTLPAYMEWELVEVTLTRTEKVIN